MAKKNLQWNFGFRLVYVLPLVLVLIGFGIFMVFRLRAANADVNGDGLVNITDLSILASNYGKSGQSFAQGDLNGDGSVTVIDLSILASAWGSGTVATSACPSTPTVNIATTDNAQSIVNAHAAGTVYLIKAGIHNNFAVTPHSNDIYCSEVGAILDGGGTTPIAFNGGSASGVTIIGFAHNALLEIRNYHPGASNTDFVGAIENNGNNNSNWLIRYTDIHNNFPVGVTVGVGTQVRDSKLHDNTTLGISSGGNSNITIDHNEFYGNNSSLGVSCGFEAGGVKLSVGTHIIYNNNYSHDNGCDGLWNDLGRNLTNVNNQITNNILIHNGGQQHGSGEHYEISGGPCTISGNYVSGNNYDGDPSNFYVGGQLFISNSFGCNVFNNTVVGSKGIIEVDDTRSECTTTTVDSDEKCPVSGDNVHDNDFYFNGVGLMAGGDCADATTCSHLQNGVSAFGGANIWQNNHYHVPNTGASIFNWPNSTINWTQWRSFGFDTTGTIDTNNTPPAPPAWSL